MKKLTIHIKRLARVHHLHPLKALLAVGFGVIIFIVLALSVRGLPGNPTSVQLLSATWRENGPFELSPERGRFALTSSLIKNKSVFFSIDMARFTLPDVGYRAGHYVSLFAPTLSFLIAPGFILGEKLGNIQVGSFAVIAVFAYVNFWLIYAISKRFGAHTLAALIASCIFLFATPAYAYSVNLYQHHVTVFLILSTIWLITCAPTILSGLGIFFLWALAITVDYPNFFLFLPVGLTMAGRIIAAHTARGRTFVALHLKQIVPVFGVILPMLFFFWFNTNSYGAPLNMLGGSSLITVENINEQGVPASLAVKNKEVTVLKLKSEQKESTGLFYFKTRNLLNGLYIHFLSQDRGIIVFTPVILLGILGISYLFALQQSNTILLASIMVMNVLLYSMWGDPWGGWAFGSRYLIPTYAILAIFLSTFLTHHRKNLLVLLLFVVVGSYSLFVNTAGALSTSAIPPKVQVLSLEALSGHQERYSFDRGVEYLRNGHSKSFAYQTFFRERVTSWQYFTRLFGLLVVLVFGLTVGLYVVPKEKKI